jgi:GDP-L-fucose synthase
MMAANVIHAAHVTGVPRLLCLGSTCIYPRLAPQPIPEDALLSGPLETTNEGYALAKIPAQTLSALSSTVRTTLYSGCLPTSMVPAIITSAHSNVLLPSFVNRRADSRTRKRSFSGARGHRCEYSGTWTTSPRCSVLLDLDRPRRLGQCRIRGRGQHPRPSELVRKRADVARRFVSIFMPDGSLAIMCDTALIRRLGWSPRFRSRTVTADGRRLPRRLGYGHLRRV